MNRAAKEAYMTPYELLTMGFYLFPVSGKLPLVKWTKESTKDPEQITKWETLANRTGWGVDCGKSGLAVLDIDSGKVPSALDSLTGLEFEYGDLPRTLLIRTPSGGYHRIYKGTIRNSASTKLGAGLDTRGAGGFIVAPGSPGYEVLDQAPIEDVPEWLVDVVGRPAERTETPAPEDVAIDSDTAVSLAARFLQNADPAIEGLGGDLHTYKVACGIRDYGVSKEKALELMLDIWNDTCSPPWSPGELEAKINNAYHYADKPIGSSNPENVFEQFDDPSPASTRAVRPLFIDAHDLIRRKLNINYLVQGLIETPTTGLIFGDPGAGKTFLALDMALSVAFGTSWMGGMAAQGPWLYFNGEGHVGIQRRIMAWLKHYNVQDIPEGIFTLTQRRVELTERSVMQLEPHIKALVDKYGPIAGMSIDTLARHLSGDADENSAKDIGGFINAVDYLKDRFSCTVATVHHSGKANKESSRGSSAIKGALDWEFKVGAGEIKFTKQKEGELPMPIGFQLETVELGDGVRSAVPIMCEYTPPESREADLPRGAKLAFEVLKMVVSANGGRPVEPESFKSALYQQLADKSASAKSNAYNSAIDKLFTFNLIELVDNKISLIGAGDEEFPF